MFRPLALALACALSGSVLADPPTELTIGDRAPAFAIEHWLRGDAIAAFKPDHVYVLEFWATWCGPCRQSMPHLSDLQEKYKDYDVTILGLSDEKLEVARDFLAKDEWRQKARYTLATDPDRSAYTDYFLCAGGTGIPTAFILGKDGLIEWIGHPMDMDAPLDAVVKGTWDRAAFKAGWDPANATARANNLPRIKISRARAAGDWATVIKMLEEQIAARPTDTALKFERFRILLTDLDKPREAYAYGHELVQAHGKDAGFLNRLAWFIVQDPSVKQRDLDLALKAAIAATKRKDDKDPAILDTLARVQFDMGDMQAAIATQRKAIALAEAEIAEELKATLKQYEKAVESGR
jgi:thiol-disulfide isomerase/thioredoxin